MTSSWSQPGPLNRHGASSVRFKVSDTSFCFMNCQLESGVTYDLIKRRQWMLNEICNYSFKQERGTIHQFYDVHQHDVKVIFGDLNFRLLPEVLDFDNLNHTIRQQNFAELLKKDEFLATREKDSLLRQFAEGPITFAPTFKYICGTSTYDRGAIPGWCDRVLWSVRDQSTLIQQTYYNRAEINFSSHKPVSACFDAQIKTVDHLAHEKFRENFADKFNQFNQEKLLAGIEERIKIATQQPS